MRATGGQGGFAPGRTIDALAGEALGMRRFPGWPIRRYLRHASRLGDGPRLCVYYERDRISFSQAFAFFYFRAALARRYGASVTLVPVDGLIAGDVAPVPADVVLVQTWFRRSREEVEQAFERALSAAPRARAGFLDAFAPNDLRLGRVVDPYVDLYFKKSLTRDRTALLAAYDADTALSAWYQGLYGIQGGRVDWDVPPSLLAKLRLCPNFFTAPNLVRRFAPPRPPRQHGRGTGVHARMALDGSDWYRAMRRHAARELTALPAGALVESRRLPWGDYMRELTDAKLCFSAFGYGEVCWRDIEAILAGSVMVKQDMSHLETLPDLYEPDVTYVPVRWDFSDLGERVTAALAEPERRQRIADAAYERVHAYIADERFADDMACLFESERRVASPPGATAASP